MITALPCFEETVDRPALFALVPRSRKRWDRDVAHLACQVDFGALYCPTHSSSPNLFCEESSVELTDIFPVGLMRVRLIGGIPAHPQSGDCSLLALALSLFRAGTNGRKASGLMNRRLRLALETLAAGGQHGSTDPLFLARFTPELLDLVGNRLATVERELSGSGSQLVEAARVTITKAGLRAIEGPFPQARH